MVLENAGASFDFKKDEYRKEKGRGKKSAENRELCCNGREATARLSIVNRVEGIGA
jgi:hypothetical protein